MKHLNFTNLVAFTLWTCIGFLIIQTAIALSMLNNTNIANIIGQ